MRKSLADREGGQKLRWGAPFYRRAFVLMGLVLSPCAPSFWEVRSAPGGNRHIKWRNWPHGSRCNPQIKTGITYFTNSLGKICTVGNWYFHLFKWGKITMWQEVQGEGREKQLHGQVSCSRTWAPWVHDRQSGFEPEHWWLGYQITRMIH